MLLSLSTFLAALSGLVEPVMADDSGLSLDVGVDVDARPLKVFNLDVSWDEYAHAGLEREMLLVNGQAPGPVIEVDEDDHVIVNVNNYSPFNTTVHFHGIEMRGTPWSDGVPGITQRPVQPGESFTYEFDATQYGSHWYHAHYRGQIEDGMYGAVLIHPRRGAPKPFDLISGNPGAVKAMEKAERKVYPLMISDFTRLTSREKWDATVEAETEISCYDAVLFNGHGSVRCIPAEETNAHLNEVQKKLLSLVEGAELTDKSCLPASVIDAFGGGTGKPEKMPAGIYEGCTPTEGSVETITVDRAALGKDEWVAIDLIGAVNFMTMVVSIDDHDMWVYAMDGSYIEPQKVQALILTNGDRYSVLVKPHKAGDFRIRAGAVSAPQIIEGHAILSVKDGGSQPGPAVALSDKPHVNIVGVPQSEDVVFFDQNAARPFPASPVPARADDVFLLRMNLDGGSWLWAMNSTRFLPSSIDMAEQLPVLFDPKPAGSTDTNTTISTRNGTWVDLVLLADAFPMPPHPIHKHGVKMYQIGSGVGPFEWDSVNQAIEERPELFNIVDPPRRDAFASPPTEMDVAWIAVRYHVTDPGPWLIHCHINNHLDGGMMVVIQDGVDAWPTVPEQYQTS